MLFLAIAVAEKQHEKRYRKLLENVKKDRVFNKDTKVKWKCRNCGFVLEIQNAPETCPGCGHAKNYFELWTENY